MDIGSSFQNYFNLNNQSIFQMCLTVCTHIWNQRLYKCKVGPQEDCMDAEDGLSRISFHTGRESMGVFWLALVCSPPGKQTAWPGWKHLWPRGKLLVEVNEYCQWFGVGLRTCCCLLISTHRALLRARMEFWPLQRCAWSEMCEPAIALFSLLNSFSRAASFHNPWRGILALCLDSKTQNPSVDVLRSSLWYQSAWFSILGTEKSNSTAASGVGENSEQGEGNLSLDNSWI